MTNTTVKVAECTTCRPVDSLEAAALRNRAARESGCDTCAKGCYCESGSAGCEHHGCWGANRSRTARPSANTCPAYIAAHARITAGL